MAYVSLCKELSDSARGDGLVAEAARSVDADFEVQLLDKVFEAFDVGLGLIAEAEVFAFVEFGDVQGLLQDVGGEGTSRHLRELFGEGQDEYNIDAG